MAKTQTQGKIIDEIYTSEKSYNQGMRHCITIIINPLLDKIKNRKITISEPLIEQLLNKYQLVALISSKFIDSMEKYKDAGKQISVLSVFGDIQNNIIQSHFETIKLYHDTMPKIIEERGKSKHLNDFLTEKEEQLQMTFQSFLILPVQRLPRYRLLFQELIKHSDKQSPDIPMLQSLLNKICEALEQVDKKMAEIEESLKFEEIHSKIGFDAFSVVGRHLLFDAEVIKSSRKKCQGRYICVFTDCLVISKRANSNRILQTGDYELTPAQDLDDFPNAITINCRPKSINISLKTKQEKIDILKAFDGIKAENSKKYQSSSSRAVAFGPVWIPDDMAQQCMICKSYFTFVHRRHHCRCCGRCVCKNCSKDRDLIPLINEITPSRVCKLCHSQIFNIWTNPEITASEMAEFIHSRREETNSLVQHARRKSMPAIKKDQFD